MADELLGFKVGFKSSNNTSVVFALFHVDIDAKYKLGNVVVAGDILGAHIGSQATSYFDVMTGSLFNEFINRGIVSKNELIISRDERDLDPLTCDGETFLTNGSITDFVTLN